MTFFPLHHLSQLLRCMVAVVLTLPLQSRAEAPASAAGHWEGVITLPAAKLEILVDLEQTGKDWGGTIDIPIQGLRAFKLSPVTVDGADIRFSLPNIPGAPSFAGKMQSDAKSITGEFNQGGLKFPFTLTRQPRSASSSSETPSKGIPGQGLAGFWQGTLQPTPAIGLRIALEITSSAAGKFEGVMRSLDQGGTPIPFTVTAKSDTSAELVVPTIGGKFEGTLNADGSELSGDWEQGGNKLPLVFKRLNQAANIKRPQEPAKPYPYDEEEVSIENKSGGVKLAGTLTLPRSPGPHPAVVLITGSGPQDRDEAIMGHRPFLVIADHLTRQGIAVLRYDDRGVGKSTGNFGKAVHTDFAEDALAAVEWLKLRKEIDPKRIGLVGHSEGGVHAPLAAVKQPGDIAFLVLLAGVGVPIDELLIRQGADMGRAMGQSEEMIAAASAAQRELFPLLKQAPDTATAEKLVREKTAEQLTKLTPEQRQTMGLTDEAIAGQAKMAASPWFRQLLAYDPRPTLRQVKCPVIALNGEKDMQVAAKDNLAGIREALVAGGNRDVIIVEFPGLNHLFQTCTTGAVNEYSRIDETFSPVALKKMSDWIREHTGL